MDSRVDTLVPTSIHRQQGRITAASGLWGHLLRSSHAPSSTATSTTTLGKHSPSIAPLDKAGASTRILLHDTQAHLEKFTDHVTQLTTGVNDAKRELVAVQKLYQDDHEQLVERMIDLVNRCQGELKKAIGAPGQASEMRDVSKDMNTLAQRVEALDKRLDALSMMNQTQSQALQTIQDQQSQILCALLPVLPLLHAVPVHIENARNHVKDSVLELRQHLLARDAVPPIADQDNSTSVQLAKRARSRSLGSGRPGYNDPSASPLERKKRRLDEPLISSVTAAQVVDTVLASHTSKKRIMPSHSIASVDNPSPDIPLKTLAANSRKGSSRLPLAELFPAPSDTLATLGVNKTPITHYPVTPSQPAQSSASLRSLLGPGVHTEIRASSSFAKTHIRAAHISTTSSHPRLAKASPGHPSLASTPKFETPQTRSGSSLRLPPQDARTTPLRARASGSSRSDVTPRPRPAAHDSGIGLVERVRTPFLVPPSSDMRPPSVPPSSTKPMSLKDRRALLPEDHPRKEEKRFIALDDEDDEIELVE